MPVIFPSDEWVRLYKDAINGNPGYRTGAADWAQGAVALVCKALPPHLPKDVGIWLDIHQGLCRNASLVTLEEAQKAPFCITAEYSHWKQIIRKELDPIKSMMQGKLKLKGDLATVVRFAKASRELIDSAAMVEASFLDE